MSEVDKEVIDRAKKYGYSNLFSHRDDVEELFRYFNNGSPEERYLSSLAIMLTVNTLAIMRAKEEVNDGVA